MIPDLVAALLAVFHRLHVLAKSDDELRDRLRELGSSLIALTEEAEPADATLPLASPAVAEPVPAARAAEAPAPLRVQPFPEPPPAARPAPPAAIVTFTPPPPASPAWPQITDDDLPLIEARCRLKADGARWAAARQRLLRERADFYADIEPHDREIIARAKALPDCFLWMCHRDGPVPADLALYDELAGCFDGAADAVALLRECLDNAEAPPELFELALDLAAEAQSAVRVAVSTVGGKPDTDQFKLFHWLRATATERQMLIRHYMRSDDPADPAAASGLSERIGQAVADLRRFQERGRRRRKLFGKLAHHLKQIQTHPEADRTYDWQKVVEAVEELVTDGVPPSNREIREQLLPLLDEIPEGVAVTRNFDLVLREIDRFLALRPDQVEGTPVAAPSEEVRRVAALLRGHAVVLIGGEKRPRAAEALTAALGLSELVWVEGWHQTYKAFEPHVARPDVAVVLLAIRWSSHGFSDVQAFCEEYGKPLVRLPAGYSPNQVAYHVLSQVGDRLGSTGRAAAG